MFELTIQTFRVLSALMCTIKEYKKLVELLNETGVFDEMEL